MADSGSSAGSTRNFSLQGYEVILMITAIFDLDGTLANTIQDLADAVNYGLRELGFPVHTTESYKQMVGNGAPKLCCRALPDESKDMADELYKLFCIRYGEHYLDNTRLYDGIADILEILSGAGVSLAIATNKPQDAARKIVSALIPGVKFVRVLGGCAERPKKPDIAVISEILDGFPENNRIYMIGDSSVDIQTAKNAGLISIGCIWGFRGRQELEEAGADFIAEKPQDIADIILGQEV